MDLQGLAGAARRRLRSTEAGTLEVSASAASGERAPFFPGFDVTPLGGVSLGRFGWEAGERMAEALAGASARG